jgi:pimeloyl-ACP methyl ester carboxylesterase
VAKDYEVVRQAFAATKFNYFGLSYGSLIGSQYLSLFPEKVGRMGLDGLVDHSESEVSTLLSEATTYEASLNQWFDWCDKNSTCALYGKSSRKAFDTLLARAEAKPIPAPGCNGTCRSDVTAEEMRDQAQLYLYFYDLPTLPNWVTLGTALAEALNGNATLLSSQLATDQVSQTLLGSVYIYLSMQCQDWLHRAKDETDITERLKAVQPFAPRTKGSGQMFYIQSRCIGWPTAVSNGQAMLNNRTSRDPPILISNAVYDPTCSLVWANGLRQQLPSAVSITRNGPGHTSHSVFGETREAMQHYLATGELPKDGTIYET